MNAYHLNVDCRQAKIPLQTEEGSFYFTTCS
nr:MAG TPA: hypothetical protein [Caudoviricetes sp.]